MEQTKEQTGVSLAQQCRLIGVRYPTLLRWIQRSRRGLPLVKQPGPAPVELIDWGRVFDDILALRHGRERTPGVGALTEKYGCGISRRDLQALVACGRAIQAQEKADATVHVDWHTPGIIWSIDTTELKDPETGRKLYIHTVQDLGSRYKFDTLSGTDASGEAMEDSVVSLVDAPSFTGFLTKYPNASLALLKALAHDVCMADNKTRDVAFKPARSRLADVLYRVKVGQILSLRAK